MDKEMVETIIKILNKKKMSLSTLLYLVSAGFILLCIIMRILPFPLEFAFMDNVEWKTNLDDKNILINIDTYAFRMRGFENLLNYLLSDFRRFIFGMSDIAYANNNRTYVYNIRNFLGWESSVEMAYVNILINS